MTTVERATRLTLARAALAGNPSDGYGGAVLAVTLPWWRAEAEALPAHETEVQPANALVEATVRRFQRDFDPSGAERDPGQRVLAARRLRSEGARGAAPD